MSTSQVNPSGAAAFPADANKRVQRQILNTKFEKITVVRPVDVTFAENIKSIEDATNYLGNDESKLLSILKSGLISEAKRKAGDVADGWFDKESEELYTDDQLDSDLANKMVLNMAKTGFSHIYDKDPAAAKAKAREFLQSPGGAPLLEGLRVNKTSVVE